MPLAPSCNRALAADSASSRLSTICPRGTATPYFERMAFAWYSCIFIFCDERERTRHPNTRKNGACWGPRTAPLPRLDAPDCLLLRRLPKIDETGDCIGRKRARTTMQLTSVLYNHQFRQSWVIF